MFKYLLYLFFIVLLVLNLSHSNEIQLIKRLENSINNSKNSKQQIDSSGSSKLVNNKYNRQTSGYNFNSDDKISKGVSSGGIGIGSSSGSTIGSATGISSSLNKNDLLLDYASGGYSGSSGGAAASSTSGGGSGLTGEYSTANHPAHDTGSGTTAGLSYSICLYCDPNCRGYEKICVQAQPRTCTPIMNPCTKKTVWTMGSDTNVASIFDDFRCTVFNQTNTIFQGCNDCGEVQKINAYLTVCSFSS